MGATLVDRRLRHRRQPPDRHRLRGGRSAHQGGLTTERRCTCSRRAARRARSAARARPLLRRTGAAIVGLAILVADAARDPHLPALVALRAQRHRPPGDEPGAARPGTGSAPTASAATSWPALLQGGRISLLVAVVSSAISIVIGFLVGAIAGLRRPPASTAIAMRSVDLAMTLPPVIFLLVLASITGTGIWPTILVIALLSWPVLSRMVRARLLELRERDFVVAARGMGAGLRPPALPPRPAELDRHPRRLRHAAGRRTPSCSRPASPSSASACRRPRRAGATC